MERSTRKRKSAGNAQTSMKHGKEQNDKFVYIDNPAAIAKRQFRKTKLQIGLR